MQCAFSPQQVLQSQSSARWAEASYTSADAVDAQADVWNIDYIFNRTMQPLQSPLKTPSLLRTHLQLHI